MKKAQGRVPKALVIFFIFDAILIAGVVAYFLLGKGGLPGSLYVYYPTNTSLFLEVQPGDSWNTRLLSAWHASKHPVSLPTPLMNKAFMSKVPPVEKNLKDHWETQLKETFKPDVSFGAWLNNPTSSQPQAVVLSVLPLKENISLKTVVERFSSHPGNFKEGSTHGVSYLVEKEGQTTLAIMNQHLLITNNPPALDVVLNHINQHAPHLFTVQANMDLLSHLPKDRQGTFLINIDPTAGVNQKLPAAVTAQVKTFQDLMPLTGGSIEIQSKQIVSRSYTPLHWDKLTSDALKTALKDVLLKTHKAEVTSALPENTVAMLSLGNVDKLVQFYFSFVKDGGSAQPFAQYQQFLSPFQLDFQRDILGLFSGETVLAYQSGLQAPIVCLVTDEQKKASLNKLTPLLSMSFLPVQVKTQQLGSVSVQSVGVRGRDQMMASFATIDDRLFALSPANGLDSLIKVKDHQTPSLQSNTVYQQLTGQLPGEALVMFFSNPRELPAQFQMKDSPFLGTAGALFPQGENALESRFITLIDEKAAD